jgi:AraC-like DNA-binding protein
MTSEILLSSVNAVIFFLLTFIALVNPMRVNVTANRYFSVFLFTAGCMLMNSVIALGGQFYQLYKLQVWGEFSRFAMAPALYLAVLHYASPDKKIKPGELWHFVPFAFFVICMYPALWGFRPLLLGRGWLPPLAARILEFVMFFMVKAQLLVYWLLSWFALRRHRRNIQLINSSLNAVSLNWLRQLLVGIGLLILLFLVSVMRVQISIAPALYLLGSLFICYFLLAQKEVYPFEEPELEEIEELITIPQKAAKKRLDETQLAEMKAKLVGLMDEQKIYLDSELDLPGLSTEMQISIHDLSFVLNEGFGANFFNFINAYRIDEARQLMISGKYKHLNILGIAYSAGFNSKSTFNTAFKKKTGISPSQFIQQVKEGVVAAPSV